MPQLWCQPFYFLILCLGLYYLVRDRQIFSEAWNKRSLETFFREQCGGELRREIRRGLLRALFGDVPLFSWLMMFSMLRQGGAGCLFWYTVCMLLWMRPLGALATLWEYYRSPGEDQPDLGILLERIRRRRGMEPRPRTARGLSLLHLVFLACLLPCVGGTVHGERLPLPHLGASLAAAALVWLVCRLGGEKMRRAAAALFLLFLAGALLWNLANLIPAIGLVLRDAFQVNRFLFALTGAGLEAAVRSGVQLGTGTFLIQGAAARAEEPSFPHPVYAGAYAQLRGCGQLALQLAVGLLFLCAEIVPAENQVIQPVLYGFFCLFGLEFAFCNLRGLFRGGRRRPAAACLGVVLALVAVDAWAGTALLPTFTWSVLWLMALSTAGLLMMDGSWYFILLEQYRDVYLWRITPHPRVSTHMKQ